MENSIGTLQGKRRHFRVWVDPLRLYDPRTPAGRFVFLWGLTAFAPVIIFVLVSVIIIVAETVSPNVNPDFIGFMVWPFNVAWVMATAAITRRRLLQLEMPQR